MGEEQDIITVTDLRKKYGSFEAVKGYPFLSNAASCLHFWERTVQEIDHYRYSLYAD